MKKFEYYSFSAKSQDEVDQTLDELGEEGWEAYAVAPGMLYTIVYLKRELP